ncbi:MAG: DUF3084 domain-containing protein [Synechocystis sp.]|nr:DUF3084 domain-containing protein [Synechocystis sp.]
MTSAYILVISVLVLGGIIAALGDHLGSKVGKARLRLFKLRPRQTAIVLTVITGTLISATTLGILFTFSKSLREGVFELDDILKQLRLARSELEQASQAKEEIEAELAAVRQQQQQVQLRSKVLDQNYTKALQQLRQVSQQSQKLRNEVKTLATEREELRTQKQQLATEAAKLQSQVQLRDQELSKRQQRIAEQEKILASQQQRVESLEQQFESLDRQRQQLQTDINQRDQRIDELDQAIAAKDENIRSRETQLQDLETQLNFLQREVEELERYYQDYQELRGQQIALLRGQLLAFGALRIVSAEAVSTAIDQLLRQANRTALQLVKTANMPVPDEPIVKVTKSQVERLKEQLTPGQEYVIRILSAGNYVQEEQEIRVFFDVVPNRQVFQEGEVIGTISLESSDFSEVDIQKRLDYLLAAAQFRARREGILGPIQVEDGRIKTLIDFIEQLRNADTQPTEVKAIAAADTAVIGPLKIRIVALKGDEILFEN